MADWSWELTGQLRALHAIGFSYREIGRQIGKSRNAVLGKAYRLGLAARPVPPAEGPRLRARPVAASPPVPSPRSLRCLIGELDNSRCHFPLWDEPNEPRFYCGAPAECDGPYCEFHMRLVSRPDREG